jgi:hypothetical protein
MDIIISAYESLGEQFTEDFIDATYAIAPNAIHAAF